MRDVTKRGRPVYCFQVSLTSKVISDTVDMVFCIFHDCTLLDRIYAGIEPRTSGVEVSDATNCSITVLISSFIFKKIKNFSSLCVRCYNLYVREGQDVLPNNSCSSIWRNMCCNIIHVHSIRSMVSLFAVDCMKL